MSLELDRIHVSQAASNDGSGTEELAWVDLANCFMVRPESFLPTNQAEEDLAKAVCLGCLVVATCLEYATGNDRVGIWGGTNQQERQDSLSF